MLIKRNKVFIIRSGRRRFGFTTNELLIVIALTFLLAAAAFVFLRNAGIESRDAKRISDLEIIKKSLELYVNDDENGEFPAVARWSELVKILAPYYNDLPRPPLKNSNDLYWYAYDNSHALSEPAAYIGAWLEDSSNEALDYDFDGLAPENAIGVDGRGAEKFPGASAHCLDNKDYHSKHHVYCLLITGD